MGLGCTIKGVCGKNDTTAGLQDLLVYTLQGLGIYAHEARIFNMVDREVDAFTVEALFTTLTNVNFDPERIKSLIFLAIDLRERMKARYKQACKENQQVPKTFTETAVFFQPADNMTDLIKQADTIGFVKRRAAKGADVTGLYGLVLFGLKGVAAYTDHAHVLGYDRDDLYADIHACLAFLATESSNLEEYLTWALRVGGINLKALELLDAANTGNYGIPEPSNARITPVKGKAILVSGHDLKDLETILQQTEGTGIHVYTHGELLPAHAYPKLKAYQHLVGNYGGAWQDQHKEFATFPGAILVTTNCLIEPQSSYAERIFTCGAVGWPETPHIKNREFQPVIEAALKAPGFSETEEEKYITVGFAHHTVLGIAGKVIDAVKSGDIRHFFLIGGCDGAKPGRNYYTDFAQKVPEDCIILTLGCGKYRFNKLDFGNIAGIPRLLDMGQCNDSYSAIQVALALANAFNCSVNELPLSLIVSWFEQKAAAVLLSLLHLGIKNIYLGPSLPAFLTPNVLKVLVEKFDLHPISAPDADLAKILTQ
jgi:hydroxylamine reductase